MKQTRWFFIAISFLILASLACTLGSSSGKQPTSLPASEQKTTAQEQPVEGEVTAVPPDVQAATEVPTSPPEPTSTPEPTATPEPTFTPEPTSVPANPVGLWTGLSSLNSYRLTIRAVSNGPTANDINDTTNLVENGSDGDSSHTHTEIIMSSADNPEIDSSTSDSYTVGSTSCSLSSGSDEIEKSEVDPLVQEMSQSWFTLVDIIPIMPDPVFVGEEELNGVMTNHFTFNVSGLGVESGAEVVLSQGEYWLAQDGLYIVKYSIVLETRNGPAGDPNTQVMHTEFHIEVKDINQEIVISLPAVCQ